MNMNPVSADQYLTFHKMNKLCLSDTTQTYSSPIFPSTIIYCFCCSNIIYSPNSPFHTYTKSLVTPSFTAHFATYYRVGNHPETSYNICKPCKNLYYVEFISPLTMSHKLILKSDINLFLVEI